MWYWTDLDFGGELNFGVVERRTLQMCDTRLTKKGIGKEVIWDCLCDSPRHRIPHSVWVGRHTARPSGWGRPVSLRGAPQPRQPSQLYQNSKIGLFLKCVLLKKYLIKEVGVLCEKIIIKLHGLLVPNHWLQRVRKGARWKMYKPFFPPRTDGLLAYQSQANFWKFHTFSIFFSEHFLAEA